MIELKYNGLIFHFRENAKMKEILENKKAIEIVPMKEWVQFLIAKDSIVSTKVLQSILLEKISIYDTSESINSFILNKNNFWLDKATRVGLSWLLESSNEETIDLAIGRNIITLPLDKAKLFLKNLEVYAGKCYILTTKHKLNVLSFKSVEDFINYDYTIGYPEKITLNV